MILIRDPYLLLDNFLNPSIVTISVQEIVTSIASTADYKYPLLTNLSLVLEFERSGRNQFHATISKTSINNENHSSSRDVSDDFFFNSGIYACKAIIS